MLRKATYISSINLSSSSAARGCIELGLSGACSKNGTPTVEVVHLRQSLPSQPFDCVQHLPGLRWTIVMQGALKQRNVSFTSLVPAHMAQVAVYEKGDGVWENLSAASLECFVAFIPLSHLRSWLTLMVAEGWLSILQDPAVQGRMHRMIAFQPMEMVNWLRQQSIALSNKAYQSYVLDDGSWASWLSIVLEQVLLSYFDLENGALLSEKERVYQSIWQVLDELDKSVSLDALKARTGLSAFKLNAVFNELFSDSVSAVLTDIRIHHATKLLASTNESIKSVAVQVGYRTSYFSQVFKKKMGMPPTSFRQQVSREGAESSFDRREGSIRSTL